MEQATAGVVAEDTVIATPLKSETLPRRSAILFIVFLGIVSLFGDMTYEGARSIVGPYLGCSASPRRRSASFPASAS
jgi:hypothetical protein